MSIGEGPDVGRTCPLWAYHLVGWPWSMQDWRQLPGGSKQAHKDPWSLCSWMWLSCDLLPEFLPWFPLSHKLSPGIVNQMPSPHIAFFFFFVMSMDTSSLCVFLPDWCSKRPSKGVSAPEPRVGIKPWSSEKAFQPCVIDMIYSGILFLFLLQL